MSPAAREPWTGPDPVALRAALERVPLFRDLGAAEIDALARSVTRSTYDRGDTIFREGDPGDALFVVLDGRVRISNESETGIEAILVTLRPGEFFGSLALLDGAPRSATATALDAVDILVLPRDAFLGLIDEVPAIREHVLVALAKEIRRLTAHVEELHFLDIAGRLAARLARLADEQGSVAPDGSIRIEGPLSQGELAAMVGSTRQSVNRFLGDLVDDGLVRVERDAIVVTDLRGLRRAARR